VDWQPNAIIWYVDGIERWRFTEASRISSEPMYLLLNLAVGGDWAGPPDGDTGFPSYFEIDYVRVWERQN
jgi:beta-glucanase (GH16 family)